MRKTLFLIFFFISLFGILAFATPYASRIQPFTTVPSTCAENSIGYSMSLHNLYICTNAGYKIVGLTTTVAPIDATYITQTANGTLTAEQALSSLSTGIMRVATTTGVITSLTDSAGIATNISDETGSGSLVFGTTPTFTTSIITPLIIGGSSTTQTLTYKTTTGVGATGADHIFLVGDNGSVEGLRILNDGQINIGENKALLFKSRGTEALSRSWGFINDLAAWGSLSLRSSSADNNTLNTDVMIFDSSQNAELKGAFTAPLFKTTTNCSDSAGAAACGAAPAGSVVIDAAATSVVVSTTAVTANSQITPTFDSSLGTRLGITCNTTIALPAITARTAGTSFTITIAIAPITNPACFSYTIVN